MKARILISGYSDMGKLIVTKQIANRAEAAGFTVDVRSPICERLHPLPDDPIGSQFCDISIQQIQNNYNQIELTIKIQGALTIDELGSLYGLVNNLRIPKPAFPLKTGDY